MGVVFFYLFPFIGFFLFHLWKQPSFYSWLFYFSIFVWSFCPLLALWIYLEEKTKVKKAKLTQEKRLSETFTFVEARVKKAIAFEGEDDLGPYWIGDLGNGKLMGFRGQFLMDFKKVNRSKIKMVFDSAGTIVDLQPSGSHIVFEIIRDEKKSIVWEKLFLNKWPGEAFWFKGTLKTWPPDFKKSKVENIA